MMDDVLERLKGDKEELNRWVGVYIGVLAVLLAICNVGGANASKDATRANIEASNTWAFYQAKNIRRTSYLLAAGELELLLATQPGLGEAARKMVEDKIKSYRTEADRLKNDPEDGTDKLLSKARSLEVDRDIALRRDPYFDWSQALLQIAIVLASVHLIIGNFLLLGLSGGLAGLGILLMLNGYTLLVALPFLG
jgi:nitroreductase